MDTCAHGRRGMATGAASQITHSRPRSPGIVASEHRGRTGELQSRTGTGHGQGRCKRARDLGTMTLATLCRLRWRRMVANRAVRAIPRAVGVCVRKRW